MRDNSLVALRTRNQPGLHQDVKNLTVSISPNISDSKVEQTQHVASIFYANKLN